ncbi:type II toxin-antitoxin system HicB family antitoxin [Selenomonas sp.]|uniref:type II toxin-antitoxin system HicB family antitoxin n=1 Tax=Selenomonas sp. TaxID=2053611 RepID=UPI0025E8A754|nr:type II toxin-antitoxin system HicB family antitoxin [Selenomonas sp.]MCI6085526.1 type II toxin-antitoxin system HicB family antitoxin [Selenomonas sp.]MDY3296167.1 type II toxin-antitoxin system HicB family antitoxin [Selenomonas sp.]MDY4417101.1 type II toxin-antitoxin system HicB family antitoxin [Selenomonas sp.]
MKNTMTYRGYVGSIEFSESDGVLFGKVLGIRSLLSYEGNTAKELVEDFHGVVDDYFNVCEAEGVEPEVAYKGSFNVRTTPDIHRRAAIYAIEHGESLNSFVMEAMEEKLAAQGV